MDKTRCWIISFLYWIPLKFLPCSYYQESPSMYIYIYTLNISFYIKATNKFNLSLMSVRIPRANPKVHYFAVVNFYTDSIFFQMSAIDNVYIVKCCVILYLDGRYAWIYRHLSKLQRQCSDSMSGYCQIPWWINHWVSFSWHANSGWFSPRGSSCICALFIREPNFFFKILFSSTTRSLFSTKIDW